MTHEFERCVVPTLDDEGNHAGTFRQDALSDLVIGVALEFGMVDALDFVVAFEPFCEGVGVFANAGHPNVKGPHATLEQVARVRVWCSAKVHFSHENFRNEVFGADDGPAENVGVAAEVLRG